MAQFAVQPPSRAQESHKLATPLVVRASHPTTPSDNGGVEYRSNGYMFAMAALVDTAGTVMDMGTLSGGITANPYSLEEGDVTGNGGCEYVMVWPNLAINARGRYKIRVDTYWVDDVVGAGQPTWLNSVTSSVVDVGNEEGTATLTNNEAEMIEYLRQHGFVI